jgi:hypothetical protein
MTSLPLDRPINPTPPATPVFASKYANSFPAPQNEVLVSLMSLGEALRSHFPDDAHTAAYVTTVARRLDNDAMGSVPIVMAYLVGDVDDPVAHAQGIPARDEWRADEQTKIARLRAEHPGVVTYVTQGGYRIVFRCEPFEIENKQQKQAWWALYLRFVRYLRLRFDIVADPRCKNFGRLFRLPNVVRDGKPTDGQVVGDPSNIEKLSTNRLPEPAGATHPFVAGALKSAIENVKSAANGSRNDVLNREAFSLGGFVPGGHVDEHELHDELLAAILENGGDDQKDSRKIRDAIEAGKQQPREPPNHQQARAAVRVWGATAGGDESLNGVHREWPDPEPFDALDVPAFPADALSPWLREWCLAVANFCQVPTDLPAVVALGVLSLAACRRYHVEVVPGWREPTNIYAVVALPPGERKSPVFAKATAPLHAYYAELCAQLAPKVAARKAERRILQGKIDAAEKAAVVGKRYDNEDGQAAAIGFAFQLSSLPELCAPTLVADDCTPEALAVLLAQGDERIGVFSAEGGPFEIMSGRYSEGARNFEIFLKAHPGDRHSVNRIKREALTLANPLIAMALTVQPVVIQGLAAKDGFRGLGLLARFLYALPRSLMGVRVVDAPEVPADVERDYHLALYNLLRMPERSEPDRSLTMSRAADQARRKHATDIEPRLGPDGDLAPMGDWAGKLTGAVCRLAGVLHLADHALDLDRLPIEIPGPTFERAAVLGDYFLEHARAAFQVMGADEETALAKRLWAWVRRGERTEFSARDAAKALHVTAERGTLALDKLVGRHLIRVAPPMPVSNGRPSLRYQVHPMTAVRT